MVGDELVSFPRLFSVLACVPFTPKVWVVNYSVTAMAKGHSRSATGALVETRRLLLSVDGSIELSAIKRQLIYGFKVTGCAPGFTKTGHSWSKMKLGGSSENKTVEDSSVHVKV